jgi:hypothetical protein
MHEICAYIDQQDSMSSERSRGQSIADSIISLANLSKHSGRQKADAYLQDQRVENSPSGMDSLSTSRRSSKRTTPLFVRFLLHTLGRTWLRQTKAAL